MRARGLAGGTNSFPLGWPAGESSSPANSEPVARWRRLCFGRNPSWTLRRIFIWGTCTMVLFHYALVPNKVTGASMTPTYRDGSVNLINRLSYTKRGPQRGDVVVLRDGEDLILKRVIAIPGEHVTLEHGIFYINGKPYEDQFSKWPVNWDIDPIALGPNEYFVIGDNRTYSMFGKFNRTKILGKVVF
jgi:signal peptidase I